MTIVAVGQSDPQHRAALVDAAGDHAVCFDDSLDRVSTGPGIRALVGVIGSVDPLLDRLPDLEWVHCAAAGVDGTLTPRLRDSRVSLTSATGNGAIPLAEHAAMLMLMLNRDARRWWRAQTERRWDRHTHGELYGKTLGILGLGNSGTHLARIGAALGMAVYALSRRLADGSAPAGVDRTYAPDQLHDFLRACDVVVITAPATPETIGLIDSDALRAMRPTASLICISRGGIVDDDALLAALQDGRLGGAGLDAHGCEPLPPDSPFWDLPNVVITPHNGATTPQTAQRGRQILLDNVARFVSGRELRNVVDKVAGY